MKSEQHYYWIDQSYHSVYFAPRAYYEASGTFAHSENLSSPVDVSIDSRIEALMSSMGIARKTEHADDPRYRMGGIVLNSYPFNSSMIREVTQALQAQEHLIDAESIPLDATTPQWVYEPIADRKSFFIGSIMFKERFGRYFNAEFFNYSPTFLKVLEEEGIDVSPFVFECRLWHKRMEFEDLIAFLKNHSMFRQMSDEESRSFSRSRRRLSLPDAPTT